MLYPEDTVKILVELGLTHTEAKVYMTLLCLKAATARNIHRASNVARQDVYQTLSDLQDKGLIGKVIAKPAEYKAIPANDVISILLQRKNEMNCQLEKRAIQHFRNFEIGCEEKVAFDKKAQFILLSKSETDPTGRIDKFRKAVDSSKKSVMGLTTFQLFTKVKFMNERVWKKAVRRGVKIRFMIARRANEKRELNFDPVLKNTDYFEVRWTSAFPPAAVLLVDDKEVFCRVGINTWNSVLWSAAPHFVAMVKDYLKMQWQSLKKPLRQQILSK